jgi:hypothetical protein
MTFKAIAATLAEELSEPTRTLTGWHVGPDGAEYRAVTSLDHDADVMTAGDWVGVLKWERTRRHEHGQRPAKFDGAASVLFSDRAGLLWWQPPADLVGDTERLAALRTWIQDYYRGRWHYVIVTVERNAPACPTCGGRTLETQSLGDVESDTDADSLAEIIGDLIHELPAIHGDKH